MRKFSVCFLFLAGSVFFAGRASAQDRVEIFGGYSFLRASVPVSVGLLCPSPVCTVSTGNSTGNLQGWEASGTYKPASWFGVTADFAGQYGTVSGASTHLQTFLVGPRFSYPAKVSPFFHLLVGGAHLGGSAALVQAFVPDRNSIAAAAGVGIDFKLFPALYLRPIQLDYLATRLNLTTQSHARISAGLALRF